MPLLASDYIDLIRALIKLAEEHRVNDDVINNPLNQEIKVHGESVKTRSFRDILEGRYGFQISTISLCFHFCHCIYH